MITSFTIKEVEPDKDGRNLMVSLIRGNNTVCLPFIRRDELGELAKEIVRYLSKK